MDRRNIWGAVERGNIAGVSPKKSEAPLYRASLQDQEIVRKLTSAGVTSFESKKGETDSSISCPPQSPQTNTMKLAKWLAICLALLCGSSVYAATITYKATGTSSGGETQNASATFVTGAGTVAVTLNDLLSNPRSIGQNISDLFFTLSNGATSGSLTSSSGIELTVNSNGTYSTGSTVLTGWVLTSSGSSLLLEGLGAGTEGPKHTIIGASNNGTYSGGTYSNANASIAGNRPHNPFLESGATFNLAISGVSAADTITGATFSFGTAAGDTLAGTATVPEASVTTLVLLGASLAGSSYGAARFRNVKQPRRNCTSHSQR